MERMRKTSVFILMEGKSRIIEKQDNGELRRELQLEINDSGHEGKPGCCSSVGTDLLHKEIGQLKTSEMFSVEETALRISRNLEHSTKEPCLQISVI